MLAAAAAALGVFLGRSGGTPDATYGGIPSWLPKPTVHVGRVVVASAAHPWRAIEGDVVSVHLARGRVRALVVGPAVPEEGQFPVPATTPCTFTVTLDRAAGVVPLRASAFTIVDEVGKIHHPRIVRALPARVAPGRTVMFNVKAVLPTGNGRLRWSPEGTLVVSWDFDVEID